ncbi:MAG: glycosyltransferase [Candidatus Thermoplasmatota archaeon]|jgi:glycosyltransferase involved in cell wall biosynthesis|nr:glycosyltransferase [Candidatus Thermoplasmatota archaeon]MCL5789175.1 glycosyltransferase [Candidatus Thermoplasmatota archaeon]
MHAIAVKEVSTLLNNTLTVVIPAYNEEDVIGRTIEEVCTFISKRQLKWKVVVSVDGNDSTDTIVSSYSTKFPFLSMMKSESRGGKGAAVKRVLDAIDSCYVVLMDADGSMSFKNVVDNLHLLQEYDGIIFSRYNKGNSIPFTRRFLSRGFNVLVQASLGIRIRDTQSGYKAFKSEMFVKAMRKVGSTNTFFDVALLFFLKQERARIKEVKSHYVHREGGKFSPISGTVGIGVSLIAFRIRHSKFYKYVPTSLVDLYYRKFRWI